MVRCRCPIICLKRGIDCYNDDELVRGFIRKFRWSIILLKSAFDDNDDELRVVKKVPAVTDGNELIVSNRSCHRLQTGSPNVTDSSS